MTASASERIVNSGQRGFWLRCFLGARSVLSVFAVLVLLSFTLRAQDKNAADCFYVQSVHVGRIRGVVLDQHGNPVSGVKVDLLKRGADDPIADEVTGANGTFSFRASSGVYGVQARAGGFQPSGLNVHVDGGLFSLFNWTKLYVVLASGGTPQSCPPEITSKRQLQEYIRHNATQK